MLLGHDMLDVVGEALRELWQATIFVTVNRASANEIPQLGIHYRPCCLRNRLALACKMASMSPPSM